ncbi:MAG: hypothetical protein H7X88_02735 [Gloeobacteraceae cyanobacterium ES-bin-316]|nr:hypothetical protein [Ferruginibacter sp.]
MSLDNIQLSPFLLQSLYTKTLVELDPLEAIPQEAVKQTIPFLGKNDKKILLVVDEKDTAFLADNDLNLLLSILSACKLSMADIALVNFNKNQDALYNKLIEEFSPTFVILFGITPKLLSFPLNFPNYQLQQYNHQTYLCAPALKILAVEKEEKKELWNSLQKHFFKS